MPTNLDDLAQQRFDLLVIGGDLHGVCAAYEAARRGLSVALVEGEDIGSDVPATPPRTLHGGLQALGRGRLRDAGRLNAERRTWARVAPHYVRPLPFLIGTYRWTRQSRQLVRAGFAAHDLLTRKRNADVPPELHLPKARLESAAATRRLFPGITPGRLSGGAVWYDYHVPHLERLTWLVAVAAEQAGARCAAHVEVTGTLGSGGRIAGARLRDMLTGTERDVQASAVLVAGCGSRQAELAQRVGVPQATARVGVTCLVLERPARDIALVARTPGGRRLMLIPWRGRTILYSHDTAGVAEPREAVDALLEDARTAFPALEARVADVRLVQRTSAPADRCSGALVPRVRPVVTRHADVARGLVSVAGASSVLARLGAKQAVDAVCSDLGKSGARARGRIEALPHAGIADSEGRLVETTRELGIEVAADVAGHLVNWYGTEASDVVRFAAERGLLDCIPGTSMLDGEIVYAAAKNGARRLADVVMRRTPLGATGHPGDAALGRSLSLLAIELGWSDTRRAAELARLESAYTLPTQTRPEPSPVLDPATARGRT